MSNTQVDRKVIKQLQLIDRVKGFDIENYDVMAKQLGITTKQLLGATYGYDYMRPSIVISGRIKDAKKIGLSKEYISGLKDALKLVDGIN